MSEKEIMDNISKATIIVNEHPALKKVGISTITGGVLGTFVPVIGTAVGIAAGTIVGGIRVLADEIKSKEDAK